MPEADIFKWEEIKLGKNGKGGSISKSLHDRLITYARANASWASTVSVPQQCESHRQRYDAQQNILIR